MKGLLFTFLATYGGAAVALFNPFVGFCIYVAFSILKPDALWHWSVPPGPYSKIIAIAMLLGWIGQGFGVFRFGQARPIVALLAAFFAWCVLSATFAPNQNVAWAYIDLMSKIHLPFLVGLTLLNSIERLKTLAWVIVLSAGYVAFELNLTYLGGFNALQEQGFAGMDNNSAAIAFVTALGMAFFLGMHVKKNWQRGICFGIAALLAHAILFSFSRGAMVATIVAAIAAFTVIPRKPTHYLAFGAAVLIGVALAGNEVRERLSTAFAEGEQRDASAQSRLHLWRDCWDLIQKHPVVGVGPDHWPLRAKEYGWPDGKEAHSLWVQNAAELGVPGSLFLFLFYTLGMRRMWRMAKETSDVPDPFFRDAARMVVTSLSGFVVAAQFVSLEGLEIPYYVNLLGAGCLRLVTLPQFLPEQTCGEEDSDSDDWSDDAAFDEAAEYDDEMALPAMSSR